MHGQSFFLGDHIVLMIQTVVKCDDYVRFVMIQHVQQ